MSDPFDCALDLMRRLPPNEVEGNLTKLFKLVNTDLADQLWSAIDQPLKVKSCTKTGNKYLVCAYNQDGDSYRSPWSNEYEPELSDGVLPSPTLRILEVGANDAFDEYRKMYYDGGVSSVYTFDIGDKFGVVVLIKKMEKRGTVKYTSCAWDSIHVFEVQERGHNAHYQLTSTIMLYVVTGDPDTATKDQNNNTFNVSGSMTRQTEESMSVDGPAGHIANIGRMVEDMESKMLNSLKEVYFGKTKDIVNDLRSLGSLEEIKRQKKIQDSMLSHIKERNK